MTRPTGRVEGLAQRVRFPHLRWASAQVVRVKTQAYTSPLNLGALDAEGSRRAYIADDAAVIEHDYEDGVTLFINSGGVVIYEEVAA